MTPPPPSRPDGHVRCALLGAGTWGQKILRVLLAHSHVHLSAVVDPCAQARALALEQLQPQSPLTRCFASLPEALHEDLDAVIVASPIELHAQHTRLALERGLDVLVEKPLCTDPSEADALMSLARASGRVAMVGHLLLYHPAIVQMLAMVRKGVLGQLRYLSAARLSPSSRRNSDSSVLWELGPHDLSVFHALDTSPLEDIQARCMAGDSPQTSQTAFVQARLRSGFACHLHLSRVHSFKERRLMLVGDKALVLWDDTSPVATLWKAATPDTPLLAPSDLSLGLTLRPLSVAWSEPLAVQIEHFIRAVRTRETPRTPLEQGALIVRWLWQAEQSARAKVPLDNRFCAS